MRVQLLDVGHFTSSLGLWRRDDDPERRFRFPIPAYLIEAGEERVLVDTGLDPDAVADPGAHYGNPRALSVFELEQEASIAEQVDLASLTRVVITHLHFDHAGGLGLLPDSVPVYLQRREWEAARDPERAAASFLFERDWAAVADQIVPVDGELDLFGDGSVRLLPTPGHTPGHQSVRVGERLLIGGDVSHFASGLDDLRFPLLADDHAAQAESARRLRALRDGGDAYLPGHDPALLAPGTVLE